MIHRIGPFAFDPDRRQLTRDGATAELGQRAAALLRALIAAAGDVIAKSDLIDAGWPGLAVEDGNLTVQIAGLRKLLGRDAQGQNWIVTVPRVGYRLILPADAAATSSQTDLPLIAVMPFMNVSGDTAQDYFGDGVVEDIITALSRFKSFAVIARNSSFAYRSRQISAQQAARELGVRYVLEGSVRRSQDKVRISAQLIGTDTEKNIWAQSFDGTFADIFAVQDRITASVAAHVAPRIEQAEIDRSRRKPPGNLDAYDLYLRALQKQNLYTETENLAALPLLEQAIALAPDFGPVLAAAAYGYEHRVSMGWPPASGDDRARAISLARAALAAAPDDAMVLARAGFTFMAIGRDYELGLQTMLRAVDRNPNNVSALFVAGAGHIWCGDLTTALAMFQQVITLSPGQTGGAMGGVAHVYLCMGRYAEALDWARRSLAEQPNFDVLHWLVIAALGHLGLPDEADQALVALQALRPGTTISQIRQANHAKYPERWTVIHDGLRLAGMAE